MDFLTLAKERYSCRKFSGKEVEQEKLEKIMEAGIAAPCLLYTSDAADE